MSRKMLINASHPEENRVAIVVDGILSELDIEIAGQEQTKGNIYKAVVVRVETGLQAAFVDYGADKLGFLQIGEIHPNIYPTKDEVKSRPRIADILQRGQEILVQIVKEERGNKGAALTTFLSIPGRYMVLMPDSTTKGVSRKISEDSERKQLKRTMAELDLPENMGYIVRTAGIGKDKEELKRDFDYLVRLYEGIVARQNQIKAPAQLYQESNLAIRSIRDYFSTDMDEVLIDSQEIYQDTKDFFSLVMPELKHLVKRHRERRPIFSRYQIEEQIDGLAKNQVPLTSGGSIVIDQTEALVAIDVNSGKMSSESGIEATALKTNLEAASEVGRQLRLRDLGGLIVIDFIDMRDRKNIREVEQQLRKALKDDKAKVSVGRISQFGLMEMSRQRLKPTLSVGAYEECPNCKGIGRIRSIEAQAVVLLRQVHTASSKGHIGLIEATVPVPVANYLLNQKRSTITELERQLNLKLSIHGRSEMLPGDLDLVLSKREQEQEEARQIMPVSHANQIESALAAAQHEEKEADQQEDNTTDSAESPTEPTDSSEAPKKRRRRRRKKPVTSDAPVAEQTDQTSSTPASSEGTEALDSPTAAPSEDISQAEEQQSKTTELPPVVPVETEKPKRRSRRPARNKTQAKPAEPAPTTSENAQVTEAASSLPTEGLQASEQQNLAELGTTDETVSATKKTPRKRTRRPTRKPPVIDTTNEATGSAETQAEPVIEQPKRRPRRSTKQKVTESAVQDMPLVREPAQTTVEPANKVEEKAEQVATDRPKQRPRRTTRKTTQPLKVNAPDNVTTEEVTPPAKKRAPRRAPRKQPETVTPDE
ncbi:MAG: Rne/Rng family ribonuclease [Deltaproteobacteria bacterium]|nr:Rne/Rng family ribonuclease [Deltaproteobacteria bacterium]